MHQDEAKLFFFQIDDLTCNVNNKQQLTNIPLSKNDFKLMIKTNKQQQQRNGKIMNKNEYVKPIY